MYFTDRTPSQDAPVNTSETTDILAAAKVLALPLVFFTLLFVIVIGGYFPYSHPAIKQVVEERLVGFLGDSVSVGGVTVTPWKGMAVRRLVFTTEIEGGIRIRASIPRLYVSYHLFALVMELKQLDRILTHAGDEWRNTQSSRMVDMLGKLTKPPLAHVLNKVRVSSARIEVATAQQVVCRASDVRFSMRMFTEDTTFFSGTMAADSVAVLGAWPFTDYQSRIRLDGYCLTLERIRSDFLDGGINASFTFDALNQMIVRGETKISRVNLARLYAPQDTALGSANGSLGIEMVIEPGPAFYDSLFVKGTARLRDVRLRSLPLQRTLSEVLFMPRLDSLHFNEIASEFSFKQGIFLNRRLSGSGDMFTFESIGWVKPDGALYQDLTGVFGAKLLDSISPVARNMFLPEPDGGGRFACTVQGSFDRPVLVLEKTLVGRAVKSVFKTLSDEFRQMFR